MEIIRGTTPTVQFVFKDVEAAQIEVAFLIIKQKNMPVIERDISTSNTGENYISWTLTQEETLGLVEGIIAKVVCDWRTFQGLRGRSELFVANVESSGKNEVI